MKKRFGLLAVALLTVLLAGNVFANHQPPVSLLNTIWAGDVTTVSTGGQVAQSVSFNITFTTESSDFTFYSGSFTINGGTAVVFSAIRSKNSFQITAPGYSITATIAYHGCSGSKAVPAVLSVDGQNFSDGSMFQGIAIEEG